MQSEGKTSYKHVVYLTPPTNCFNMETKKVKTVRKRYLSRSRLKMIKVRKGQKSSNDLGEEGVSRSPFVSQPEPESASVSDSGAVPSCYLCHCNILKISKSLSDRYYQLTEYQY